MITIRRRGAKCAKKILFDINVIKKKIIGLVIAVRRVTIGETVVVLPFKPLAHFTCPVK